jgi:predicted metal-dependent HD superfamily phosphohydrolase
MKTARAAKPSLVKAASGHVRALFRHGLPPWVMYHNLSHTLEVVKTCGAIARTYRLSPGEREILALAAWFHDTGYTVTARGHEEASVRIAEAFLAGQGLPPGRIDAIGRCIMATRVPQRPRTALERILCDADLSSLGRGTYFRQNGRLKLEIEKREGVRLREEAWLRRSWQFLHQHRFHTEYGRRHFEQVRRRNLDRLTALLAQRSRPTRRRISPARSGSSG